jgi:hypothetical protein
MTHAALTLVLHRVPYLEIIISHYNGPLKMVPYAPIHCLA